MSNPRLAFGWFKCRPKDLLGALSGLRPEVGYVYTIILLRIYEANGPIEDDIDALSRRTGLQKGKVTKALDLLATKGKISIENGWIDSESTYATISERMGRKKGAEIAGKKSAEKRAEKNKQYQQTSSGDVAIPLERKTNERSTILELELELELERESPIGDSAKPEKPKPKKEPIKRTPKLVLETVLSVEMANAVVEHRKKLRKPLTEMAAQLLAKQFEATGRPNEAAQMMIERGWQGFKSDWFVKELGSAMLINPRAGRTTNMGGGVDFASDESLKPFLNRYFEDGSWPYATPPPGQPGCRVPEDLLPVEFRARRMG